MSPDKERTRVIFRTFPDGDLIALFPGIAATMDPFSDCQSYQHIGQHGTASVAIVQWTRPATREEYAPLARELRSIGYRLDIRSRFTRADLQARINQLEQT